MKEFCRQLIEVVTTETFFIFILNYIKEFKGSSICFHTSTNSYDSEEMKKIW